MCAVTSQPGIEPITPPLLAAIQTSHGTSYVPRARNYQGFLVQRRYRGLGAVNCWQYPPQPGKLGGQMWQEYEWLVPYWHPVLNTLAIEAARLDYMEVAAWVQTYGEAVFTHPTYAPLCLRWGHNGDDCLVSAVHSASSESRKTICFTTYTHPLTGEHAYCLETPLTAGPLLADLQQQAGLIRNSRSEEDGWRGYTTRNLVAAQRVVTAHGYSWAWAQRYSVYEVAVYSTRANEQLLERCWQFATPEEARAWFGQLSSGMPPTLTSRPGCTWATLQTAEMLLDEVFPSSVTLEKYLSADWTHMPPSLNASQVAAVRANGIRGADLSYRDRPMPHSVRTLASILDEQNLTSPEIATHMNIPLSRLKDRLHDATQWTESELERVAHLTKWAVSDLRTVYPFK